MTKFIVASFLMLGWGFYEMSGGADFVPEVRPIAQVAVKTQPLVPVPFGCPRQHARRTKHQLQRSGHVGARHKCRSDRSDRRWLGAHPRDKHRPDRLDGGAAFVGQLTLACAAKWRMSAP